jgi:hypothetical protein
MADHGASWRGSAKATKFHQKSSIALFSHFSDIAHVVESNHTSPVR